MYLLAAGELNEDFGYTDGNGNFAIADMTLTNNNLHTKILSIYANESVKPIKNTLRRNRMNTRCPCFVVTAIPVSLAQDGSMNVIPLPPTDQQVIDGKLTCTYCNPSDENIKLIFTEPGCPPTLASSVQGHVRSSTFTAGAQVFTYALSVLVCFTATSICQQGSACT